MASFETRVMERKPPDREKMENKGDKNDTHTHTTLSLLRKRFDLFYYFFLTFFHFNDLANKKHTKRAICDLFYRSQKGFVHEPLFNLNSPRNETNAKKGEKNFWKN